MSAKREKVIWCQLGRLRSRRSGVLRSPNREYGPGKRTANQLVSNVDGEESKAPTFKDHRGHLCGYDEAEPYPKGCLNSSHGAGGFRVVHEVSEDIDQHQRHDKSQRQFFRMTLTFYLPKLFRGPVNKLNELISEEQRGIPEASENVVNQGSYNHCRVLDFHVGLLGGYL